MKSNIIIAGGMLLLGAIIIAAVRPVSRYNTNSAVVEQGIVTDMYETSFKDLVVKLKGQGASYYIDATFHNELSLQQLKEKLMYKPVVIKYTHRWTPLKEEDTKHYISKLEYDGEVIYNDDK